MYDPTVFENLKVAFENHVYDLDNLDQKITITNRMDRMDLAVLARDFAIQFKVVGLNNMTAEISLTASLRELAGELLEMPGENLGCALCLRFMKRVQHVKTQCNQIEQALNTIWEDDIELTQTLSFEYGQDSSNYLNNIELKFKEKINEEHMEDIPDFLYHVLKTVEVLDQI
ncbi:hypothetical protein MHZ95_17250 [Sporosarcina sp. ACRSM]|uniref:hypothetical protein n=1 Tax=Sporosarcina sp. ACRSM TaxID=2918216 RepID=UPI001EF68523|nr:hypothetical protein [Sporosarcina sp. ACRSM]MCG7337009.1 hypothetical protein [Sporosarcina sp. ACRSM]